MSAWDGHEWDGREWSQQEWAGQEWQAPEPQTRWTGPSAWSRWGGALFSLLCCLLASVLWAAFVLVRTGDYPNGTVPAGKYWAGDDGYAVGITSWRELSSVQDAEGRVKTAPKGTRWVIIQVQYKNVEKNDSCGMVLVAERGVQWSRAIIDAPDMGGPSHCSADDAGPDPLVTYVYLVPESMLPRLRGLEIDHIMMIDQPPLFLKP